MQPFFRNHQNTFQPSQTTYNRTQLGTKPLRKMATFSLRSYVCKGQPMMRETQER